MAFLPVFFIFRVEQNWLRELGTKSKTRRLRSALRIVIQEYGDQN